ncbi:hypothetical protein L6164_031657 [Bauhinia variegata]|uniref:Uncharacterized protein n=1 Tax=Bauhinia variegata TaxID=167791 RepID=A0ACB9LHA6_BAUVA|nr:hypothetical protein L6164_031657 [Bauhinia variegata]
MDHNENSSSFSTGNSAQEKGLPYVPQCYVIPSSHRACTIPQVADIPVIDMEALKNDSKERFFAIEKLRDACRRMGFFQLVNHGVEQSVLDEALLAASIFFNLPTREKATLMSNDVHKPVRYGTSYRDGVDKIQFWRIFLKHYAHPLKDWIHMWPDNPHEYRWEGYCQEVRKVGMEVIIAIIESLGLRPTYLKQQIEDGMQVMALNCYPPCPEPEIALGLPPHSDYSCLTILYQSSVGLEIMDLEDATWKVVPQIPRALQVHVGDHFEVLSNGSYKSVVHRATLNSESTRISIVSLFSLGMDGKMETAPELVDEKNPKYRESSFRDFLNFLASNDIAEGKSFLGMLKIKSKN